MKNIAKKVFIPGVGSFPSMKEACQHQGISYGVLTLRLRNDYYSPENQVKRDANDRKRRLNARRKIEILQEKKDLKSINQLNYV